jgi:hypothetical protein
MTAYTWGAATSGNWAVNGNWVQSQYPGKGGATSDTALINKTGSAYTVTYNLTSDTIAGLTVSSANAKLAFNTNDVLTVSGPTSLTAGEIDVLNSGAILSTGTLTSSSGTTFDLGSGGAVTIGAGGGSIGGLLESTAGTGTVTGTLSGTGTIEAVGATLDLKSNVSSTTLNYQLSNSNSSILQLDGTVAAGNTFTFLGAGGEVNFNNSGTVTENVVGLNVGSSSTAPTNFIALLGTGFTISGSNAHSGSSGTITLKSGAITDTLTLTGVTNSSGTWFVDTKVVGSSTEVFLSNVVCYAAGTRILTATGERVVESLMQGEMVLTLSGGELSARPIKWLGRRRIDLIAHPRPETVAPIRIQRDAITDNMPHSDVWLSPDHAILVDGKLISARQLINGTTIQQEANRTSVDYFHIELDEHAILLAEGLPAESYLNTGNRGFFANSDDPLVLHPDLTDEADYPTREAGSCAPFVWDEDSVRPVWQRLADRAAALGSPVPAQITTTDPELRLVAKGRSVKPIYGDDKLAIFALPRGATEARLVSRAQSPTQARPWLEDRRLLGVRVARIVLRSADDVCEVPVDHPDIERGWWAVEREGIALRRWTNGDAVVPLPKLRGETLLEIHFGGLMTFVTDTEVSPADRAA